MGRVHSALSGSIPTAPAAGATPHIEGHAMTPQTPPTDRPLTAGDDWIEWHGGENPVPGEMVQVRFRDGFEPSGWPASSGLRWPHKGSCSDIIAYRLSRPATSAASEGEASLRVVFDPFVEGGKRYEAALASPPVSERERELEGALRLFRAFVQHNATQWKAGSNHHHPAWLMVAEALGNANNIAVHDGPEWRFIQPDNQCALTAQPAGEPTHG